MKHADRLAAPRALRIKLAGSELPPLQCCVQQRGVLQSGDNRVAIRGRKPRLGEVRKVGTGRRGLFETFREKGLRPCSEHREPGNARTMVTKHACDIVEAPGSVERIRL